MLNVDQACHDSAVRFSEALRSLTSIQGKASHHITSFTRRGFDRRSIGSLRDLLWGQIRRSSHLDWTDKVFVSHQDVCHHQPEENSADPGTDKTLYRLFGGDLDELGAPKCDSADVGKDIIGDY